MNGERNFRCTAKECTVIRRKQKKYKKAELNVSHAEITDLVLQARAKLSDNKVNGPERRDHERDDQKVAHGKDLH